MITYDELQELRRIARSIQSLPSAYTRMNGPTGNGDRVADLLSGDAYRLGTRLLEILDREEAEPEWEYAWEADEEKRRQMTPRGPKILSDNWMYTPEDIMHFPKGRRIRRRPAGPWEGVEESDD